MITNRTELALTWVLVLTSILVAATIVRREFFGGAGNPVLEGPPPAVLPGWEEARTVGQSFGTKTAPITVVELGDVECPACRQFHSVIASLLKDRPNDIQYVFVHFPLSNHRFAEPAARAVDCAASAGQSMDMLGAFYAKQDSLGLKSWGEFAQEAGVEDTTAIVACALTPDSGRWVAVGKKFAKKIDARFTPTVLVNGWMLSSTPDRSEMDRIITALLAGDAPFSSRAK